MDNNLASYVSTPEPVKKYEATRKKIEELITGREQVHKKAALAIQEHYATADAFKSKEYTSKPKAVDSIVDIYIDHAKQELGLGKEFEDTILRMYIGLDRKTIEANIDNMAKGEIPGENFYKHTKRYNDRLEQVLIESAKTLIKNHHVGEIIEYLKGHYSNLDSIIDTQFLMRGSDAAHLLETHYDKKILNHITITDNYQHRPHYLKKQPEKSREEQMGDKFKEIQDSLQPGARRDFRQLLKNKEISADELWRIIQHLENQQEKQQIAQYLKKTAQEMIANEELDHKFSTDFLKRYTESEEMDKIRNEYMEGKINDEKLEEIFKGMPKEIKEEEIAKLKQQKQVRQKLQQEYMAQQQQQENQQKQPQETEETAAEKQPPEQTLTNQAKEPAQEEEEEEKGKEEQPQQ